MKKSIESRTLVSSFWGSILIVINFVQGIIFVPFFLDSWGNEKYGIWISIFSFITLVKTINLGHQNYIGNEFNKVFHVNSNQAKKIIGSSFWVSIFLGILECIIFGVTYYFISTKIIIGSNRFLFTDNNFNFSLIIFVSVWGILGSVGGVLIRMLLPIGLFNKMIHFAILYKLLEIGTLLLAIIFHFQFSTIFFVYAVINFLYSILVFIYIKLTLPDFFPWWHNFDLKFGLSNLAKSIVLTFNAIIEQFNSSGIVLLVSNRIGLSTVPLFTTIRTSTNVLLQVTSLVTNPLAPEIIRYNGIGENEKIFKLFDTNCFLSSILVNLPFLLIIPFISRFFFWWTKGQLLLDWNLYSALMLSVCFINFGKIYFTFLSSMNTLKEMMIITFTRIVLTIGLCFLLIPDFHLAGVGYSIVISEFICALVLPVFFVSIHFKLRINELLNEIQILSIFQIIIIFLLYYHKNHNKITYIYLFGLISFIATLFMQWKFLDIIVKGRIVKLINKIIVKW